MPSSVTGGQDSLSLSPSELQPSSKSKPDGLTAQNRESCHALADRDDRPGEIVAKRHRKPRRSHQRQQPSSVPPRAADVDRIDRGGLDRNLDLVRGGAATRDFADLEVASGGPRHIATKRFGVFTLSGLRRAVSTFAFLALESLQFLECPGVGSRRNLRRSVSGRFAPSNSALAQACPVATPPHPPAFDAEDAAGPHAAVTSDLNAYRSRASFSLSAPTVLQELGLGHGDTRLRLNVGDR